MLRTGLDPELPLEGVIPGAEGTLAVGLLVILDLLGDLTVVLLVLALLLAVLVALRAAAVLSIGAIGVVLGAPGTKEVQLPAGLVALVLLLEQPGRVLVEAVKHPRQVGHDVDVHDTGNILLALEGSDLGDFCGLWRSRP